MISIHYLNIFFYFKHTVDYHYYFNMYRNSIYITRDEKVEKGILFIKSENQKFDDYI